MVNEIITWFLSNRQQREVIKAAKNSKAFITTEFYMYDVSKISTVGTYYILELTNKIPLGFTSEIHHPTVAEYIKDNRPETSFTLSSDAFNILVKDFSEWNYIDKRVMLYYDKFVKSYKK